jgi:dihydrodipicolinate synthase/N-acetylneuraminate lyase
MTLTRDNFIGPWAGLPVAWTDDDRLDEATYRQDVAACCQAGVPGVYTGGSTGEFYALSYEEFQAVARATVEVCHEHGTPAMIGCTDTYTKGAMRKATFAAEIGADAIQVALPFWMPMPADQIVPFFREVASAAPGLALSVYETTRAKVTLTVEQHLAVKDAVPQVLMVKANANTVGLTEEGCRRLSEHVNVFVGEHLFAEFFRYGARGGCSSAVYWSPKFMLRLWEQVRRGEWAEAEAGCAKLKALFGFLGETWEPRGFVDTSFDRLGGRAGGFLKTSLRCRAPYPHATEGDVEVWRGWCRENLPEMIGEGD